MAAGRKNTVKRGVDISMALLLLFLMSYQVTGQMAHEWIGIIMTALALCHQILNRKWYNALLRGRYHGYRIVVLAADILLLAAFALTAFCGASMSGYAVPFLSGMAKASFARRMHLSMSYWAFVFMGLHLGLHMPVLLAKVKFSDRARFLLSIFSACMAGSGLYLFLKNGIQDYLLFRVPFAFLDYEKAAALVLFENMLILMSWAFLGAAISLFIRVSRRGAGKDQKALKKELGQPVLGLAGAVIVGLALHMAFPVQSTGPSGNRDRNGAQKAEASQEGSRDASEMEDGFILIQGGTYQMGSPDTENWRIPDEVQHEVTVSDFYMDPYEMTQEEYQRLTGENPSAFAGGRLPVENVSWLDALKAVNKKSEEAGLTPAYTITEGGALWDRSADGYRLPTEAEWEYACRGGTTSAFYTEKSLSAEEANFYGHYPYEIEENYFDNSRLEAGPGEYRATTVEVGSFEPNPWGLYDMHGNVNEWCWDYYGDYDTGNPQDPAGSASGTRHVYRGGGWNDFGKNMRSAYRGAGQADLKSSSLGIRLVRSAKSDLEEVVEAKEGTQRAGQGGKTLIAYFSWGGNTRGIAREIQEQTGADLFEICPAEPYSEDYNTVLMEAQEDQHNQARPPLDAYVENMDSYDTILLGYPNWWASIPMPVAVFLEEYDFAGKQIIPFCSHGGGGFGQSLTAIAKLAPDGHMGEGLSVHYSGGESLSEDVEAWLTENGIQTE